MLTGLGLIPQKVMALFLMDWAIILLLLPTNQTDVYIMKRIVISLTALLLTSTAWAQLHYGFKAGYGLNNAVAKNQHSSTRLGLGYNHGFYLGGELRYNLSEALGLQVALQLDKMGTTPNVEAGAMLEGLAKMMGTELKGLGQQPDSLLASAAQLKGVAMKGTINHYNISLPLSVRCAFGQLGITAGIDLRYTVSSQVSMSLKMPGGVTLEDKMLEQYLPAAAYVIDGGTPPTPGATMTMQKFHDDYLLRRFGVGLHVGADYELYDNVALQVAYRWGLSSTLQKRWNDALMLQSRSLQVGMVYMF